MMTIRLLLHPPYTILRMALKERKKLICIFMNDEG